MSILVTVSAAASQVIQKGRVVGATAKGKSMFVALKGLTGKALAGLTMSGFLAIAPMASHAADSSCSKVSISATESQSGSAKSDSSATTKTTTTKASAATTISADVDKAGAQLEDLNPTAKTSKTVTTIETIGKAVSNINPIAGAAIDIIGEAVELATPKPKTTQDKINDVLKAGEAALHDSIKQGSLVTSKDMIKGVAALNTLASATGLPSNMQPLVKSFRAATEADPDKLLAAAEATADTFEKAMNANGFQVSPAQKGTLSLALQHMLTVSDPNTENLYGSAMGHFEDFLRNSQNATGTPLSDLSKAATAFAQADQSATPLVSAKNVGGVHLYNAAVALRDYQAAKDSNNAAGMAKSLATLVNEGQAAVQAKFPGKYTTLTIDPEAIAAIAGPTPSVDTTTASAAPTTQSATTTAPAPVATSTASASTPAAPAPSASASAGKTSASASAGKTSASASAGKTSAGKAGKAGAKGSAKPSDSNAQAKL